MNKIVSRLCVFFIGIPIVLFVVFVPLYHHLVLHLAICAFAALSANELFDLYAKHTRLLPKPLLIAFATLLPVVAALYALIPQISGKKPPFGSEIITYTFIAELLLIFLVEVCTAKDFTKSNSALAASIFTVLYAGYLLTFISRLTFVKESETTSCLVATFLMMVFLCDSFAWLFGMLLGKNNKGFIKASPNKSIAGFIGGFIGSIVAALCAKYIWPNLFFGSVLKMLVMAVIIALSAIVGDLTESVFKRSAGVKDSGTLIPGRGGVLDSMDSIIMASPVYYLLLSLLFGV